MIATSSRPDRARSARDGVVTPDGEEPLLAPLPGPNFEALDRRQSVIGWWIGLAIGTLIAAAAIVMLTSGI